MNTRSPNDQQITRDSYLEAMAEAANQSVFYLINKKSPNDQQVPRDGYLKAMA